MERRHHLATDHGPMVQRGLLTAHPGSDHGDGGAPGGDSSLRQGAGTGLLAIPRSESRRRRNSGENRVTEVLPRVFGAGVINRPKGGARGASPDQVARWCGHPPGSASQAPGQGVAPLRLSFGLLESSVALIFYLIFLDFSEHFNN